MWWFNRRTLSIQVSTPLNPGSSNTETVVVKIIAEYPRTFRINYKVFETEEVGLATHGDYYVRDEIIGKDDPRIVDIDPVVPKISFWEWMSRSNIGESSCTLESSSTLP